MKFSILIAHYNNSLFFKDCFDSIIKQTYSNFEAIIIDDCSEESEKQTVKRLIANDKRFFFYENEYNEGVGYTKKKCADLATGDILGFVDPDDALVPEALEESIKAFKNKNIIAAYSQFYLCSYELIPQKLFANSKKVKNKQKGFLNLDFEVSHFFTFRKTEYEKTEKINEHLTSSVDQDLYLKLYDQGNFHFIKKGLYLYRIHKNGISQNKNKKENLYKNWHIVLYDTLKRRELKKIFNKHIDEIKDLPAYLYKKRNTLFFKIIRKIITLSHK
ncbi:glycosyltransferase family 2 protein [Flavobacterium sp. B17]|uniref:glycosyltransferase family 2 protein n=1 Tax=Flavobacterium sp. B17 TaxID=95618 RepID=UPI00034892DD|nr:glycosyltransferase family 2 protein [Flavobacterium sp. B17]